MTQQDEKEWQELMGTPLSESALNIDMGAALTAEEKQALWSVEDEKRQTIVESNGNTGEHYEFCLPEDMQASIRDLKEGEEFSARMKMTEQTDKSMVLSVIGGGSGG